MVRCSEVLRWNVVCVSLLWLRNMCLSVWFICVVSWRLFLCLVWLNRCCDRCSVFMLLVLLSVCSSLSWVVRWFGFRLMVSLNRLIVLIYWCVVSVFMLCVNDLVVSGL